MALVIFIPELRKFSVHTEHVLTIPSPSTCFLFAHPLADVPFSQQGLSKGFSVPKTRNQKEISPKPHLFTVKPCVSC